MSTSDLKIAAAQSAQKWGVDPTVFSNLIGSESSWNPNAVNPVAVSGGQHASGIAQFLQTTADAYGVSNTFDPISALDGSAHYLSDLQKKYGNTTAATMAYKGYSADAINNVLSGGSAPNVPGIADSKKKGVVPSSDILSGWSWTSIVANFKLSAYGFIIGAIGVLIIAASIYVMITGRAKQ
ncbi:MAG: transglycosylase SLT domain-containing protein [Thermoplasmataceae archaeon]